MMNSPKKRGGETGLPRYVLTAFLTLIMLTAMFTTAAAVVVHPGQTPPPGGGEDMIDDLHTPKPSPTPTPTPAPPPEPGTYQPYGPVSDIVIKSTDGRDLTYYDIYGGSMTGRGDTSDEARFLVDLVTKEDNYLKWLNLAYCIFESDGRMYWDHAGNGWDHDFGDGHYIDFIKVMQEAGSSSGDDRYISSGISIANSLSDVQKRAAKDIADCIGRKVSQDDFVEHHKLGAFDDGTTGQKVVYSTAACVDRYGSTGQYGYNAFGVVFYDFQLHVLDDGEALNTAFGDKTLDDVKTNPIPDVTYSDTGTDELSVVTQSKNTDRNESSTTVTLQQSKSGTSTTTSSATQTYSMGETFGASSTIGVKVPAVADASMTLSRSINFGQSFGFTKSDQEARTTTDGMTIAATMKVPPHTVGALKESKTQLSVTTRFDCPVGITYKVAIFSMNGTCYDDNAATRSFSTAGYDQRTFITIFGDEQGDAVENLYQRGIKSGGSRSYDQTLGTTESRTRKSSESWANSLDWNAIYKAGTPVTHSGQKMVGDKQMVNQLINRYPMSVTGLQFSSTTFHSPHALLKP